MTTAKKTLQRLMGAEIVKSKLLEVSDTMAILDFEPHRHKGTLLFDTAIGYFDDKFFSSPLTVRKRCKFCYRPMNFTEKEFTKLEKQLGGEKDG